MCNEVMLEFFVTNAPSPHYWNLDSCLAVFLSIGSIWDSFATTRNSMQNGLKWCNQCKSSFHKVALEIYATNGPDPPHWTLNSCFGAFLSILGAFGTISLLHETRFKTCQTVAINAKVSVTKSCQNFSQSMLLIHTTGP